MAIRINLLPKREKRRSAWGAFLALVLLPLLLGGIWVYWQASALQQDITQLNQQILSAKVAAEQRQKTGTDQAVDTQLQQALQAAEAAKLEMLPILRRIISFLPERGVFQTFSYQESGLLVLEVRFDEKRDAAYFYSRLRRQAWVQDMKLSSLQALEVQNAAGTAAGLPRYVAHYEVTLVKEKAKALAEEETS